MIDNLFLYSDKYVNSVLNLKMHYFNYSQFEGPYDSFMLIFLEKNLKDLSGNRSLRRQNANVATRFPGENYSEYDLDFIFFFSKIVSIISFKFRDNSRELGINNISDRKLYISTELNKIFRKVDIRFKDYDPLFIEFVQDRLDNVYPNEKNNDIKTY